MQAPLTPRIYTHTQNYSQLAGLFVATVLAMILLLAINFRDVCAC